MKNMMSQTADERTLSVHNEHEFLLKLEKAGLDDKLAQKVVGSKDNELALKVIRLIANGGYEPSTGQKLAREIMGKNFFGIEEAIKYFGVNPGKREVAYLAEIPFSEEVLKSCKDTHILVAVFSIAVLDIRGHVKDKSLFYNTDWYNKKAFAKEKGEVGWYLIRRAQVANSTAKTWDEQKALLSKDEETPTAQVMVYSLIGNFFSTGERLFKDVYVRTSSLDSDGDRVDVGDFDAGGLDVSNDWDDDRDDRIGLSASRKQ